MNYYWFIKNGLYRATNTLVIIKSSNGQVFRAILSSLNTHLSSEYVSLINV